MNEQNAKLINFNPDCKRCNGTGVVPAYHDAPAMCDCERDWQPESPSSIELITEAMGKLNSDIYDADDICHDSVQFVVDGLDDDIELWNELWNYATHLQNIIIRDNHPASMCEDFDEITLSYKATEDQKTEAILKSLNLWTKEMEDGR